MARMIFFIKRKNTPLFDVFMLNETTDKKLCSNTPTLNFPKIRLYKSILLTIRTSFNGLKTTGAIL